MDGRTRVRPAFLRPKEVFHAARASPRRTPVPFPSVVPHRDYAVVTVLAPTPAQATFHFMEITKIMAGFEGDEAIEAVEMTMLANGQNFVNGTSLKVYSANGTLLGTLGTFSADVPVGLTGRKILFATMKWRQKFGLVPDLQISPGIPATTGQVAYEAVGCLVNAIAYGGVTVFKNGTTAAPPLPIVGATALDRGSSNGTFPSCPLGENAGAWFGIAQGFTGQPITFTNNSGAFASVLSTVTGVEPTTPAPRPLRAAPNPFHQATDIEFASAPGRVVVHDVQGRFVRSWGGLDAAGSRIRWDGTDARGRAVAAGIYFVRALGGQAETPPLRIVRMR